MKIFDILSAALICVLVFESMVQGEFWNHLLQHLGHQTTNTNTSIRSHCGRNRYEGALYRYHPISKRIVGGDASRIAEWPWLVSLQLHEKKVTKRMDPQSLNLENLDGASMKNLEAAMAEIRSRLRELSHEQNMDDGSELEMDIPSPMEGHVCAGALISPWWILSAKHCFDERAHPFLSASPDRWTAILGEHNIEEADGQQEYEISEVILYPDEEILPSETMEPAVVKYDIALVKLARPAVLNEFVQIVCLPNPDEVFKERQVCSVAGWGFTEENGEISKIPRHIRVPLLSKKSCEKSYAMLPSISILDTMVCAGGKIGQDACQYDSGGPLVCRSLTDNEWIVTGIVSTGIRCGSRYPGIYTKVSYFLDWIKKVTSTV